MPFSKSFPRTKDKFPVWEEVFLTDDEERAIEKKAEEENIELMKKCIDKAKKILQDKGLKDYQTDLIHVAVALYRNIASHQVYHKEAKAKEKFDARNKALHIN